MFRVDYRPAIGDEKKENKITCYSMLFSNLNLQLNMMQCIRAQRVVTDGKMPSTIGCRQIRNQEFFVRVGLRNSRKISHWGLDFSVTAETLKWHKQNKEEITDLALCIAKFHPFPKATMPVRAHSAVKCVTISHTGIIWVKNEKLQMYIPQDISLIKNSRGNCRCIRKGSDSSQCILILHQRILVTGQDLCLNIMKNNRKSFILVLKIIFLWKYPLTGGISSLPVPQTEPTCSL